MDSKLSIAVMIPSYLRAQELGRCLDGIEKQIRPADQIIVILRNTDTDSIAVMEKYMASSGKYRLVLSDKPGLVYAQNKGLAEVSCDILAITDDDAVPQANWLALIEEVFLRNGKELAGVGGRDYLFIPSINHNYRSTKVGCLTPWGVPVGLHHCGIGPARDVLFLKGVNSAYKTNLLKNLGFASQLKGPIMQAHWEMILGFQLVRLGYRLIYDPEIMVDHYATPRPAEFARLNVASPFRNIADDIYNQTFALAFYLNPLRLMVYILFAVFIGTRGAYGLVQTVRFMPKNFIHALVLYAASMAGLVEGVVDGTCYKYFAKPKLEKASK